MSFRDWGIAFRAWRAYFHNQPLEWWIAVSTGSSVIIALCALVVSFCALTVTIWQGWTIREHQRLTVTPFMNISFYHSNEDGAGWILRAGGVGPAWLRTFEVFVDEKSQPHWGSAGAALGLSGLLDFDYTIPRAGLFYSPGGGGKIFWFKPGLVANALILLC
jgi:hypothetical protein